MDSTTCHDIPESNINLSAKAIRTSARTSHKPNSQKAHGRNENCCDVLHSLKKESLLKNDMPFLAAQKSLTTCGTCNQGTVFITVSLDSDVNGKKVKVPPLYHVIEIKRVKSSESIGVEDLHEEIQHLVMVMWDKLGTLTDQMVNGLLQIGNQLALHSNLVCTSQTETLSTALSFSQTHTTSAKAHTQSSPNLVPISSQLTCSFSKSKMKASSPLPHRSPINTEMKHQKYRNNSVQCARSQCTDANCRLHAIDRPSNKALCTNSDIHVSLDNDFEFVPLPVSTATHLEGTSHIPTAIKLESKDNSAPLTSQNVNHGEDKEKCDDQRFKPTPSFPSSHFSDITSKQTLKVTQCQDNALQIKPMIKKELRVVIERIESLSTIAEMDTKKRKRDASCGKMDKHVNKRIRTQSKQKLCQDIKNEVIDGSTTESKQELCQHIKKVLGDGGATKLNIDEATNGYFLTNQNNTTGSLDVGEETLTKRARYAGNKSSSPTLYCKRKSNCNCMSRKGQSSAVCRNGSSMTAFCIEKGSKVHYNVTDVIDYVIDKAIANRVFCSEENDGMINNHENTEATKKPSQNKPTVQMEEGSSPCSDIVVKVCFKSGDDDGSCDFTTMEKVGECSFSFVAADLSRIDEAENIQLDKEATKLNLSMGSIALAVNFVPSAPQAVDPNIKFSSSVDTIAPALSSVLKDPQDMVLYTKLNSSVDNTAPALNSVSKDPQDVVLYAKLNSSVDTIAPAGNSAPKAEAVCLKDKLNSSAESIIPAAAPRASPAVDPNIKLNSTADSISIAPVIKSVPTGEAVYPNTKLNSSSPSIRFAQDYVPIAFSIAEPVETSLEIKTHVVNRELKFPVKSDLRSYRMPMYCKRASTIELQSDVLTTETNAYNSLSVDSLKDCIQKTTALHLNADGLTVAENFSIESPSEKIRPKYSIPNYPMGTKDFVMESCIIPNCGVGDESNSAKAAPTARKLVDECLQLTDNVGGEMIKKAYYVQKCSAEIVGVSMSDHSRTAEDGVDAATAVENFSSTDFLTASSKWTVEASLLDSPTKNVLGTVAPSMPSANSVTGNGDNLHSNTLACIVNTPVLVDNSLKQNVQMCISIPDHRMKEVDTGKFHHLDSTPTRCTCGGYCDGSQKTAYVCCSSIPQPVDCVPFQQETHPEINFVLCHFCGCMLPTEDELEVHLKLLHVKKHVFLCHLCGYCATSLEDTSQHQINHNSNKEPVVNFCCLCGHLSLSADEMVEHSDVHCAESGFYLCDSCGVLCNSCDTAMPHSANHYCSSGPNQSSLLTDLQVSEEKLVGSIGKTSSSSISTEVTAVQKKICSLQ